MNERTVFLTALDKEDAAERSAYLDQACGGDAALRERVESLLRSHAREGAFLDVPAVEQVGLANVTQDGESPEITDRLSLEFLAASDKPGSLGRLDHYEIQEVVGKGGMGVVLKAFDEQLQRVVAIKVMAAQLATSATARKRFSREAQAAAAVSHDHIVTIHAVAADSALPYLVMQYVAGTSLQQRLDRDGPLELHEILRIGMQTASGLVAAHAQGLVHRDIKPANILLENGVERVKITDFGLARAAADANLTQSGVVAGTPQYMSPEQAEGKPLDQRTDLFSLGSVLYAMCVGRAPFRASGSMAVLKRVCEETPSPIRDSNPQIPDWLVAIVDKLHAKDPAERFQSAAEVADLLGRHLAHVQHPSVAPMPLSVARPEQREARGGLASTGTPFEESGRATRRRLAVAAAILLCLIGGLSLTEATGVTNLRSTVIRILTPDGTLVVETDDPAVKVTVEGDGGLVITGAGLEEIRLRPGSYRIHADKDGKPLPLDKDLVTVARGGRAIVKVKLEAAGAAPAKAEGGAFVVLTGKGAEVRKFDTLAEAVQGASDGDTIEVRGNGPFVLEPVRIHRALTIRAGRGFRPSLRIVPGTPGDDHLIATDAPLVLEGLDIREVSKRRSQPALVSRSMIYCGGPSLRMAGCRVWQEEPALEPANLILAHSDILLRNCEFRAMHVPIVAFGNDVPVRCVFDNCVGVGGSATYLHFADAGNGALIEFHRSTFATFLHASVGFSVAPDPPGKVPGQKRVRFEGSDNVFDMQAGMLQVELMGKFAEKEKWQKPADAEAVFIPQVGWAEKRNVYSSGSAEVYWSPGRGQSLRIAPGGLKNWQRRWNLTDTSSLEGPIRFDGGDLRLKAAAAPEKLTPEDFRLHPDSAGYRAGKDGKDLGADVDLVGPGPAYERWKKTSEYQQWLKDTKQGTKAQSPTAEPKAFVVLTGKGVEVQDHDTLAHAVQGANDGDTIEIRGNGPFVTEPIIIRGNALLIRAGKAFRPVLELSRNNIRGSPPILETYAPLILEGLEFQQLDQLGIRQTLLRACKAPLYIANCRFRSQYGCDVIETESQVCEIRNCEFYCHQGCGCCISTTLAAGQRLIIDNCVTTEGVFGCDFGMLAMKDSATVQVRRSTCLSERAVFGVWHNLDGVPSVHGLNPPGKPLQLAVSDSVFDAVYLLHFNQRQSKTVPAHEAEALVTKFLGWRGQRNLHAVERSSLFFSKWNDALEAPKLTKRLAQWRELWGSAEARSLEGRVRYLGGEPFAKLRATPRKITPEDFRLRPDSPGYRAGKDGKDLGADVDLVGPGPAYERWKKTPEYQQWLKDTKQVTKAESPKPELKAFVVLTGKGVEVSKFDTLAEAVQGTGEGDTIEVRGNGPFLAPPIKIRSKLTIRAGDGFRPVFELPAEDWQAPALLQVDAALVLEGLEFRRMDERKPDDLPWRQLLIVSKALHAANCRFVTRQTILHIAARSAAVTELRNCEFLCGPTRSRTGDATPTALHLWAGRRLVLDNCVVTGQILQRVGDPGDAAIHLTRNTFRSGEDATFRLNATHLNDDGEPPATWTAKPVRVEVSSNLFRAQDLLEFIQGPKVILPPGEAEKRLKRILDWKGERNAFALDGAFLRHTGYGPRRPLPSAKIPAGLPGWKALWRTAEADSLEGPVVFHGGNILAKLDLAPEKLTPEDFRLRSDSTGYHAGKDGKDLGANVDLVGPGPAYERWKKTPEYQQWLKDTKHVMKVEEDAGKRELARWQGEWENPVLGKLSIKGGSLDLVPQGRTRGCEHNQDR